MNEWMNEWMKMYILVSKTFINENNEWMNEWMNERFTFYSILLHLLRKFAWFAWFAQKKWSRMLNMAMTGGLSWTIIPIKNNLST